VSIKRKETIVSGSCEPSAESPEGLELRLFASEATGANGFSTGMTSYAAGTAMPSHIHDVGEAMTILEGRARVLAEGREYMLSPYDCIYLPAGTSHSVENAVPESMMRIHSAFGGLQPITGFVHSRAPCVARESSGVHPEKLIRFDHCPVYELSPGALFRDLFARRLGSVGICGGYGLFGPGASLPCHTHNYDESITIVLGEARCQVRGSHYRLSSYDTAVVPEGRPHRFINESDAEMAMIWVYAGDEPDRLIVDNGYCSGAMAWPEP
jgi:quercetin dioxygenase-like cupin family protein